MIDGDRQEQRHRVALMQLSAGAFELYFLVLVLVGRKHRHMLGLLALVHIR